MNEWRIQSINPSNDPWVKPYNSLLFGFLRSHKQRNILGKKTRTTYKPFVNNFHIPPLKKAAHFGLALQDDVD